MNLAYPLFDDIHDGMKRKRALAAQVEQIADEIIHVSGMPAEDLRQRMQYIKEAVQQMNKLP